MKIILFMIFSLLLISNAFCEDKIYIADMEYVITQVKDYRKVNDELLKYRDSLDSQLEELRKKIADKKKASKSLGMLNPQGKTTWSEDIVKLEEELVLKEKYLVGLVLERERSLKFPLIKKVLEFIQRKYDKTNVNFIVDPESIFFYKSPSTQIHDLTNEIINSYNEQT